MLQPSGRSIVAHFLEHERQGLIRMIRETGAVNPLVYRSGKKAE